MKQNNPDDTSLNEEFPDQRKEIEKDFVRTITALSAGETINRYGQANAEYIKGYTGIDNKNGLQFRDSLKSISQQKKGLAQKAGTTAEIIATSNDNANNIIDGKQYKSRRTDDQSRRYGTNHPVADRVKIDSAGIETYTQMKFESDPKRLVDKLVRENGEYAKYLDPAEVCETRALKHLKSAERADNKAKKYSSSGNLKLEKKFKELAADLRKRAEANREIANSTIEIEVPSEQVESIKKQCRERAKSCINTANDYDKKAAEQKLAGNLDSASELKDKARQLKDEADRCDRLEKQVTDSGVSQKEANNAASKPLKSTTINILKVSHRAGIEGAKYSSLIGGAISLLSNMFSMAQDKKQLDDAALDVLVDTGNAAALGYTSAFAGSALKGSMEQSSNQSLRTLAGTSVPALAVSICLSLGSSVNRYVSGEISEAQFLSEIGEKGAGMLSSGMMAALGQIAIPVPFLGAAVGGMIGYTLSSFFYQSAMEAARGVELSRQQLTRIKAIEAAARDRIAEEQAALKEFTLREIPQLQKETQQLFDTIQANDLNVDELANIINEYATLMGKKLEFRSMADFEEFMNSERPLIL